MRSGCCRRRRCCKRKGGVDVPVVIRSYISFREWKVDAGDNEGESLEKEKTIPEITKINVRIAPAETRNFLDFINSIITFFHIS